MARFVVVGKNPAASLWSESNEPFKSSLIRAQRDSGTSDLTMTTPSLRRIDSKRVTFVVRSFAETDVTLVPASTGKTCVEEH